MHKTRGDSEVWCDEKFLRAEFSRWSGIVRRELSYGVELRVSGKVVRFDRVRGYGFITPDGGGEDVFLHANDLEVDKSQVYAGVRVTFGIEAGERGQFATAVRLAAAPEDHSAGGRDRGVDTAADDDYYDLLSPVEFSQLVTELLLHIRPALGAEQILQTRERFMDMGRRHGWLDEA